MSTHDARVVSFTLQKHPNADTLSLLQIPNCGYTVLGRTSDWIDKSLGIYINPDTLVPVSNPVFSFLAPDARPDGYYRVRAKKLRGVVSYGLMIPAPSNAKLGEDFYERLELKHYEPPENLQQDKVHLAGECASGPNEQWIRDLPRYDLENLQKFPDIFQPDEMVLVREKLDGSNIRIIYHNKEFHIGSRNRWLKEFPTYDNVTREKLKENGVEDEKITEILDKLNSKEKRQNEYWKALRKTPAVEKFCRDNPDILVYGEVFGNIGKLKYSKENELRIFEVRGAFGFWNPITYLNLQKEIPMAPYIGAFKYNLQDMIGLAEGQSMINDKVIREGIVLSSMTELPRKIAKVVSATYLEKF